MSPSSPSPSSTTPLADLLGCRSRQREYDSVLATARRCRALIERLLGPDWWQHHLPATISDELDQFSASPGQRKGPRRDKTDLFGLGLPVAFVALSLRLPEDAADGWTILQALLLAGVLLRHRDEKTPGKVHTDALAQFLTSTDSATSDVGERLRFIHALSAGDQLGTISETLDRFADLPAGFTHGLHEVIRRLQRSRRTVPGSPKQPKSPDSDRPPAGRPCQPVRILQEEDNPTEVDVRPALPLSPEEKDRAADSAEAVMEQAAATLASLSDEDPGQAFHEREARAKRQFLDVRQALWAPEQWDALTGHEMRSAVRRWFLLAETALSGQDLLELESALLSLLVGSTGWTDEMVWRMPLIHRLEDMPKGHSRALLLDSGEISFPVPQIGQRYDPDKKEHGHLLMPVTNQVILRLPDRLVDLLQRYAATQPRHTAFWLATDLLRLRENVRSHQKEARLDEPRETLARMRNAHGLRLINLSQDLPLAQLASGELLGVDDVGLSYVSCPMTRLQALCGRVWEAHGYGESTGARLDTRVGGSRLQIADEAAQRLVSRIRAGLSYGKSHEKGGRVKQAQLQTDLAAAVAWLLCAGLGIRPNARLGYISIRNFSLRALCMVAADKVLDEGHLGRLVPLPPMIVRTLLAYGRHLEALSSSHEIPGFIKDAARSALQGSGPLLFVPKKGKVEPLTLEVMRNRLPSDWVLPLNVFRHRVATGLRSLECPGVYAEAVLGHVELGTQPFGSESFMPPLEYLAATSRHVESLLERDGWKVLQGLPGREDFEWEARPLGAWILNLRPDHEKAIQALRSARRQEIEGYRDIHWDTALARVDRAIEEVVTEFETARAGKLDRETIYGLRKRLTESAESHTDSRLLVEGLRARLVRARDERQWKIARMPYFHVGPVEPSPFHPEYPAVLESFLQLRQYFVDVLNRTRSSPRPMTARARLVLGLIVWHGVADWDRLAGILSNLHRARPVEGLDDALLIPVPIATDNTSGPAPPGEKDDEEDRPPPEVAEVLRGPLVAAAASFVSDGHPVKATAAKLGVELASMLPLGISTAAGGELVPILVEAARIVHLFEHAPPMRDVWTNRITSMGLPSDRIERLFTSAPIRPVEAPTAIVRDTVSRPSRKGGSSPSARPVQDAYRLLRDVLRVPRGKAKKLPLDRSTLPVQTADATMRQAIAVEVTRYLEHVGPGEGLCQLLGQYAYRLLTQKTTSGKWLHPGTPYGYTVHAGACLVRTRPGAKLLQMEPEDLYGLYREAVQQTKKRYRPWVAKYLTYFHAYLVEVHEAPPVDLRSLGGSVVGLPEVGLVTPREYQAAVRALSTATSGPGTHSVVESRQAIQAISLGYATGGRTSEVNLRERRDLVVEHRRSALLVRANRFTGLKTYHSARILSLEGLLASDDLESIKASNALILRNDRSDAPLFPDTNAPEVPTDPNVISRQIGHVLRAVTGEPAARQYWLRHNAASMEMLALFADEELIRAIRRDDDVLVPLLSCASTADFAQWLGGNANVSQIHAAAFRSRRGHSTMRTSTTTYIHTFHLIEPMASRAATAKLTSKGLGTLSGRSEDWIRQLASRAGLSMHDTTGLRKVLARALVVRAVPGSPAEVPAEPVVTQVSRLGPRAIARGVECYFRSGDMDESVRRMGLSKAAETMARNLLDGLAFQPSARRSSGSQSDVSLLEARCGSLRQPFDLRDRMLDTDALNALLAAMRQDRKKKVPLNAVVWELVLNSADTRDAIVRCRTSEEIVQAFHGLSRLTASMLPSHRIVLVVPDPTDEVAIERDIRGGLGLTEAEVVSRGLAKSRMGWLPMGVALLSPGGQIRIATLLVAAICWHVWTRIDTAT